MEVLKCPFCCDGFFNSRQTLIKHLSTYTKNIHCPICDSKYFDINALIEHIRGCTASNKLIEINVDPCTFNPDDNPDVSISATGCSDASQVQDTVDGHSQMISGTFPTEYLKDNYMINHNYAQMELFSKNENQKRNDVQSFREENKSDQVSETQEMLTEFMDKSHIQTGQQLELFNANGESEFVFIQTNHDPTQLLEGDHDGTEMKVDETVLDVDENVQTQDEANMQQIAELCDREQEEISVFNCTACDMSFTSVLEHIKMYHNDQDVVVEMNGTSLEGQVDRSPELPQDSEKIVVDDNPERELSGPQETEKRVITETGQIETFVLPITHNDKKASTSNMKPQKKTTIEKVRDSKGRMYTRKLIQIGKFWKEKPSLKQKETKTENEHTEMNTRVHHTVLKMIDGPDGKVKTYHCVACGIYVKSIEEFKKTPCEASSPVNPDALQVQMKENEVAPVKTTNIDKEKFLFENTRADKSGFFCNVCCTTFKSNKSLRLHVRMHDPIKARPIVLPRKMDAEDKFNYYNCKDCGKSIPLSYKSVHDDYHKVRTQFHCEVCNRIFVSKGNLLMHMNIHNTDKVSTPKTNKPLPYTCIYCNKQFGRPHEKVKHERIHTGEKPYKCEVCGKTFRITYCLTLHMRTHSGDRPYECKQCGKSFKAHSVYNHHLMTHSEVRAYKCPYCPKAFKTAVLLNGHKNSHTKPFACTVCNRRFASLYAVRMHMEYHQRQNRLKYSCTICGAIYARKFALRDHIKLDHSEQTNDLDFESLILKEFPMSKIDDEAEIATQAIIEESDSII